MAEDIAQLTYNEAGTDGLEVRITTHIEEVFEILGRPSRQQVLYAKDKKELK